MTDEARITEKPLLPEHYIFDGVIGADELLWIYHELLSPRRRGGKWPAGARQTVPVLQAD
jgi:hypothetical protein